MSQSAVSRALGEGSNSSASSTAPAGCMIVEGACVSIHPSADAVFYNRVQIFNRDLSVCVLHTYAQQRASSASRREVSQAHGRRNHRLGRPSEGSSTAIIPGLFICEALAASGLRSVRYARELVTQADDASPATPLVDSILVNDMDAAAVTSITRNTVLNGVAGVCTPTQRDAVELLYAHRPSLSALDVVDLDPYGSASIFLDAAVQAVCDGGMLAVTCTDMQVLAGTDMHACRAKYGCTPLRTKAFGEQALRVVLGALETSANRYHRTVEPMLSVSVDFYVRLFVRVWHKPLVATAVGLRMGSHIACTRCHSAWTWPASVVSVKPKRAAKAARAGMKRRAPAMVAAAEDAGAEAHEVEGEDEGGPEAAAAAPAAPATAAEAASTEPEHATPRRLAAHTSDGTGAHQPNVRTVANAACPLGDRCPHCDGRLIAGGPLWLDPIHNIPFAQRVLATMTDFFGADGRGRPGVTTVPHKYYDMSVHMPRPEHDAGSNDVDTVALCRQRLMGVVRSITEELPDAPLYFDAASLTSTLRMNSMPVAAIVAGLRSGGYRASMTHTASNCVKTDAPVGFVWDVMRTWVKTQPGAIAEKNLADVTSLSHRILTADLAFPEKPVDFTAQAAVAAAIATLKAESGPRYVPNPGVHWGPGSRASGAIAERRKRERKDGEDVPAGAAAATEVVAAGGETMEEEMSSKQV